MPLFGKPRSRRAAARAMRSRALGERDQALRHAERSLALDPESELAQALVAELLPREDTEVAIARLQALLHQGAKALRVSLELASLLRRAGRPEQALEVLPPSSSASVHVVDRLELLRQRSGALGDLERWDECVEVLRELADEDGAHSLDLAKALERAGRAAEALPLRREYARLRADDWFSHLRTLPRDRAEAGVAALGAEPRAVLALPTTATLAGLGRDELQALLRPLPSSWRMAIEAHVQRCSERCSDARATLGDIDEHPVVRFERALLDIDATTIGRAVEALDRLREEGWLLPSLAYFQAMAHHVAGDDARAAALYRTLLAEEPDHGHAWYLLSDVLERLEGPGAERGALRRAYVACPLLFQQVLRSPLVCSTQLAARSRIARLDPDDPELVASCAQAGEHERARTLLSIWATKDGSSLEAATRVRLARVGLAVEAHDVVSRLVAPLVDAEHPEALAIDGERLVAENRPVLAIERLGRATALDPSLGRAWEILGVLHAQRKELALAEPAIRRAAKLLPEIPHNHRNLARLLLDTQRGAEAVEPAERVVAMLDRDPEALHLLARAYAAAGDDAWAQLTVWAASYQQEQAMFRMALGNRWSEPLPGNVQRPPDVFRANVGRFRRRLEQLAAEM